MNTYVQEYRVNYIDNEFKQEDKYNAKTRSMLAVEYTDSDSILYRDIVVSEKNNLLGRCLNIDILTQIFTQGSWKKLGEVLTKSANDGIYVNSSTGEAVEMTEAHSSEIIENDNIPGGRQINYTLNVGYETEFDYYSTLFGDTGSSHYAIHKQVITNVRGL